MMEVWRDIKGYEGYYKVSSLGRLKSLKRSPKILTPYVVTGGYIGHKLCKDGKERSYRFHRIVASAFLDNPNNLPEVNHKNGIKTDNRVENIEWCSRLENARHATKNDLRTSSLKYKEANEIRVKYKREKRSQKDIGIEYSVGQDEISRIVNYKIYK